MISVVKVAYRREDLKSAWQTRNPHIVRRNAITTKPVVTVTVSWPRISSIAALISIFLSIFQKHKGRQGKRHQFRHRRCQPDTVHAKNQRKYYHGNQHKHKGPGKCKDGRNNPIRQCSKHPAGKNIKSDKKQCSRAYPVSCYRQIIHRIIRSGEDRYQRPCQQKRNCNRKHRDSCNHFHADSNQLFQFSMVLFPMIKTQHGRNPIRISCIQRACKHQHIHDDGNRRHTVFPNVTKHRPVEYHSNDPGDKRRRHLGTPICGGICKDFKAKYRFSEM